MGEALVLRPWEVEIDILDDGSGCHTSLYWLMPLPGLMWT